MPRSPKGKKSALTGRQADVATLLTQGLSNKEIARRLDLTERAVKYHLTRLYSEYGVHDRAGLIAKLLAHAGFGMPAESGAENPEDESRMFAGYNDAPVMIGVS